MNEIHGQGTHSANMSADKLAKIYAPKLFAQFLYPSLKVWDFDEKRLNWESVVLGSNRKKTLCSHIRDIIESQENFVKKTRRFIVTEFVKTCDELLNYRVLISSTVVRNTLKVF